MGPWNGYTDVYNVFDHHIHGEGQAYVFNFAYNLYWMKYARLANQLDANTVSKTIEKLKQGDLIAH